MGLASLIDRLFSFGHAECERRASDLARERDNWQRIAEAAMERQAVLSERLLLKERVMPLPEPTPPSPPKTANPIEDHFAWAREDERLEIEEKARQAMFDPELAAQIEEYAEAGVPEWGPVRDRYRTMRAQVDTNRQ